MSKVWSVVSLLLLYYALNSFLATQGGNAVFGATLIMTARVPAAFIAIPICSFLLLMSGLIGIEFARRGGANWADRVPLVAFDQIDTTKPEAKLYQAVVLTMLSIVPALTLIHFWTTIWGAELTSTEPVNPRALDGGIWAWKWLTSFNNPAYVCTEVVTRPAVACNGGATILPGLEPTLFAAITLAAYGVGIVFLVFVIRGPASKRSTI